MVFFLTRSLLLKLRSVVAPLFPWLLSLQGVVMAGLYVSGLNGPLFLPPFPGDANDCEQTPTQASHILCTAQASTPAAMTLLDLGALSILVQSQDRRMQNWVFFILNSTQTLLILGSGFLQMELMGLLWHDDRYFPCPREPEHARGWWTGKLEPQL